MTKLKHFRTRLNQMADCTYTLLRGALLLSCTMTLCALALFYHSGGPTMQGFDAYKIAQELMGLGTVTLLLATIASAIVEEIAKKREA